MAAGSFWGGFMEGVTEHLQKSDASEKERALKILEGLIEGNIEPMPEAQPGATPEQPLITGPRRPRNIGEMIKSGFGLGQAPQQGYRKVGKPQLQEWKPTTREEALEFEQEKAGISKGKKSLEKTEALQEKAAGKGWQLSVSPELSPEKQAETARTLLAEKIGETTGITRTTAVNILADPFKAQQLKRQFPDLYEELLQIAGRKKGLLKSPQIETDAMDTDW